MLTVGAFKDKETLLSALRSGADVNALMPNSETPLYFCIKNHPEWVSFLLDANADIHQTCKGETPLEAAIKFDKTEVVRLLLKNEEIALDKESKGPLVTAAIHRRYEIMKMLLEKHNFILLDWEFNYCKSKSSEAANILEKYKAKIKLIDTKTVIKQGNILNKYIAWLQLQLNNQNVSQTNAWDKEYLKILIEKFKEGHCAGFSWLHRIACYYGESEIYQYKLKELARWNEKEDTLSPRLDQLFSEMVQATILLSSGESLKSAQKYGFFPGQMLIPVGQRTVEYPRLVFHMLDEPQDLVRISVNFEYQAYTLKTLMNELEDLSHEKSMIYLTGKFKGGGYHAIDVGLDVENGKKIYWIYDSNCEHGKKIFTNKHTFFSEIAKAFNYYDMPNSLDLTVSCFNILSYSYEEGQEQAYDSETGGVAELLSQKLQPIEMTVSIRGEEHSIFIDTTGSSFVLYDIDRKKHIFSETKSLMLFLNEQHPNLENEIKSIIFYEKTIAGNKNKAIKATALVNAIKGGDIDRIRFLLKAGVRIKDIPYKDYLHKMIMDDYNIPALGAILNSNTLEDVNPIDEYGCTLLYKTICAKKTIAFKMLVEAGADINKTNEDGELVIIKIIEYLMDHDDYELLLYAFEKGAWIDENDKQFKKIMRYVDDELKAIINKQLNKQNTKRKKPLTSFRDADTEPKLFDTKTPKTEPKAERPPETDFTKNLGKKHRKV